jgi:hypothetical protein
VDRVDDLGRVDPLEVGAGDAEVGVSELALDDRQRDAFACHLDSLGVTKLVRRESSTNTRSRGQSPELGSRRGL